METKRCQWITKHKTRKQRNTKRRKCNNKTKAITKTKTTHNEKQNYKIQTENGIPQHI